VALLNVKKSLRNRSMQRCAMKRIETVIDERKKKNVPLSLLRIVQVCLRS
jgi:hypothetical protein